jgi:hypothetical protein
MEQGDDIGWRWVTNEDGLGSLQPIFPEMTPAEAERDRQFLAQLDAIHAANDAAVQAIIGPFPEKGGK